MTRPRPAPKIFRPQSRPGGAGDPLLLDYSKHIQKAEEAIRRRNYDFAIQLFQQLLEIEPDQADARAGLRVAVRKKHETKKGGAFLRKLGGSGPLAMAKTLRKAGKHAAAAKSFESYLASNPLDVDANLQLGMCLEEGGFFNSARVVYEFTAEIAPKNPEGLKRAGAMMQKAGEFDRALEYYERALEADPRDQEALKARKNLAAETALSSRERGGGVKHSRDQVRDSEETQALERARRRHRSEEDLREDLERLEARYADDPSNVDLMVEMAEVLEKLKEPDAALDLAERALSYRKNDVELEGRIGVLRTKSIKVRIRDADKAGDSETADRLEKELWALEVEELQRRLRLHPGDAGLRLSLGKALLRSEDLDGALAEFQKAVGDPRLKREATFHLGVCFQGKGFPDLARKEFENALEGSSDGDERSKEILYNLGSIAEAEGDDGAARGFYSRIFGVDIGYRDVSAKMERLK